MNLRDEIEIFFQEYFNSLSQWDRYDIFAHRLLTVIYNELEELADLEELNKEECNEATKRLIKLLQKFLSKYY